MYKLCLALFLTAPAALLAQGLTDTSASAAAPNASSSTSSADGASAPASTPMATENPAADSASKAKGGRYFARFMDKPDKQAPVGSLAATYTYVASGKISGNNRSLMGWTVTPEVNFTRHLGLQADFTSLYVRSIYPGQTRLLIAAGPRYNFAPSAKINPFLFAEGGEIRISTKANAIKDWNPVAKGGFGFDYKIARGFGLELIPGEYIGQHSDNDSWMHSFSARAGVVFNFYK